MPLKSQYETTGGFQTATIYSGQVAPSLTSAPGAVAVGSDVLLYSGAGRLNSVTTTASYFTLSGVVINLYDAAAPVSGGPIAASGHKVLAVVISPHTTAASGALVPAGQVYSFSQPFTSGLCVNSRSGQMGVTVTWTPEQIVNRF